MTVRWNLELEETEFDEQLISTRENELTLQEGMKTLYNQCMNANELKEYIPEAVKSLLKLKPIKIMIFGSAVSTNIQEDSDLDLLIVLDNNTIPNTYEEKLELKLQARRCLRSLNKKVPIDLLVYTIPEYEELKTINSSFFQEIHRNGKIMYEKAS
jgi:uncharacterized protein